MAKSHEKYVKMKDLWLKIERKRHLEGVMDSSTWHVNNLEKVLRFLRNGQLTVQQVEDIKSAGALVRLRCFKLYT